MAILCTNDSENTLQGSQAAGPADEQLCKVDISDTPELERRKGIFCNKNKFSVFEKLLHE